MKLEDLGLDDFDKNFLQNIRDGNIINAGYIFELKKIHDNKIKEAIHRVNNVGKPLTEKDEGE